MFSPTVNAPFTWWPLAQLPRARTSSYCSINAFVRAPNSVRSLVGPPVDQVAVAVVLGALVVEPVADLVADHRADAAVVGGVVGLGVEERRLQNRCGKDDLVHAGVVVGVDGLRRHEPLVAVDRPAELGQLAVVADRVAAQVVADRSSRSIDECRVVAPLGRDSRSSGVNLSSLASARSRVSRRHPLQVVDADAGRPRAGWRRARPSAPWPPAGSAARRTACRPLRPSDSRPAIRPASSGRDLLGPVSVRP